MFLFCSYYYMNYSTLSIRLYFESKIESKWNQKANIETTYCKSVDNSNQKRFKKAYAKVTSLVYLINIKKYEKKNYMSL